MLHLMCVAHYMWTIQAFAGIISDKKNEGVKKANCSHEIGCSSDYAAAVT